MSFGAILGDYRDVFLEEYWQKKPLLIRQAFPGGLQAVDPDQLAGLACLEGIDARLVLEHGAKPWQVWHGPFRDKDFATLPATHWTLLVQAVDRLIPAVSELRQHFRFLPNWRVDDIMISYASDQGSVGPHTDNYDVFLIQGQGRRRWEISAGPLDHITLREDLELKILVDFVPELSFELEEGDMLYLPPRVAHHGVALGPCLTYSVGFRAPTRRDLLLSYAQFLLQEAEAAGDRGEIFYRDANLHPDRDPGELQTGELEALWKLMESGWQRPELFKRWVGAFLTEPRSFHDPAENELDAEGWAALLKRVPGLRRSEGCRFSYYVDGTRLYFYCEGECLVLPVMLRESAAAICRESNYPRALLAHASGSEAGAQWLLHLWNQGFLYEDEDE